MKNSKVKVVLLTGALMLASLSGCGQQAAEEPQAPVSAAAEEATNTLSDHVDVPEVAFTVGDSGYEKAPVKVSGSFFAMDTYMQVVVYSDDSDKAETAINACAEEVNRLENLLSTNVTTSEIYQLNEAGTLEVSDETKALLERSIAIGEDTDTNFDITVYPIVQAWGFTTNDYKVPSQEVLDSLLPRVGAGGIHIDGNTVTLDEGVEVGLGALAKGYTSQRLMSVLTDNGITSATVSLGGNVQVLDVKPDGSDYKVAIQNPLDADGSSYAAVVAVHDTAVITSGGYERYFEEDGVRYHHIIDPETGYPADQGLVSATVISPDGTLDDALATTFYIMGLDEATTYWRAHAGEFDIILIDESGDVYASSGLEGKVQGADLGEINFIS